MKLKPIDWIHFNKVTNVLTTLINVNNNTSVFNTQETLSTLSASNINSTQFRSGWYQFLSLFLPWLYFLSTSLNLSTLPKYVNSIINNGDIKVSQDSAQVYGNISGLDSFFTFLSVNFIGCLSDIYGRKIFMMYASLGLGLAYYITLQAKSPSLFYLGGIIDGLTSCMMSQSQAYIADLVQGTTSNISVELSKFHGIAIGCAWMFGIPFGSYLSSKYSLSMPLTVSVLLCLINFGLIALLLPSKTFAPNENDANDKTKTTKLDLTKANPFGAYSIFTRTKKLTLGALTYFLIYSAQAGFQVNWINFLQYKFGWSSALAGSTLMLVGVIITFVPSIIVPMLGTIPTIKYGLLLYGLATFFLSFANDTLGIFVGMAFLAAGASSMPMLLGYLTQQVSENEVGALQGAADTLRTMSAMISSPLFAKLFGLTIDKEWNNPSFAFQVVSLLAICSYFVFYSLEK